MNSAFIFESIILLISGVILIRLAGKKSVARMTGLETVIILAIGTTMGHATKEHKLWQVIFALFVYVIFLIITQKLQLKSKKLERYLIGEAILVINKGKIIEDNLRKLRMTKEQLEMRLRQSGISYISDVKIGTIESDGNFGYELVETAKPVTQKMLLEIMGTNKDITNNQQPPSDNIFNKVINDNK